MRLKQSTCYILESVIVICSAVFLLVLKEQHSENQNYLILCVENNTREVVYQKYFGIPYFLTINTCFVEVVISGI